MDGQAPFDFSGSSPQFCEGNSIMRRFTMGNLLLAQLRAARQVVEKGIPLLDAQTYQQSAYLGKRVAILLQLGVRGDIVLHLAVVELLVGHHVEVARAGEAEEDGLLLAGLLAL